MASQIVKEKQTLRSPSGSLGHRAEEQAAARLNLARLVPGSGNRWWRPGDIQDRDFLVEVKSRGSKQITFEKGWLDKIFREASAAGRLPLLLYQYRDSNQWYAVLPFDVLEQILSELSTLSGGRKDDASSPS